MTKLTIILLALVMMSCGTKLGEQRTEKEGYDIVTIDGCEYIEVSFMQGANNGYYSLTHKGNCKNHSSF
jgi:hypothetical protein